MSRPNLSAPNSSSKLRQAFCWAALALAAVSAATLVCAQSVGLAADDAPASGRIVPIAPGGAGGGAVVFDDALDAATQGAAPQAERPQHWIGILLAPLPDEVRAQVDIPENQGVLVAQVVPNSPAAQAGVQLFDIVLSANDQAIVTGRELMDLVQQQGESGGKIKLDVVRRGVHQSIELTPAERPESPAADANGDPAGQWGSGGSLRGMPGMRNFGPLGPQLRMSIPHSAFGQAFNLSQMPNGVSVSIQKQNDEPAHITVKRGNDTWEIVGDDPAALAELPDDVRPFVERMLSGNHSVTFQMPDLQTMHGMWGPTGFNNDAIQQQLHRMEQQLQQMRMQLEQDLAPPGQPSSPILPQQPDDTTESEAN